MWNGEGELLSRLNGGNLIRCAERQKDESSPSRTEFVNNLPNAVSISKR